ncbi:hypothetical protein M9H77_26100 [Catharanthus roseus]|uniref:Uncharacterized protein n=1 Tax=Catharanthus roseus TaxID=4058 RepID=A0ACC0AA28_CATRO|nr:hypothetical protein M9H77_26100 [Catharanthus roseus]
MKMVKNEVKTMKNEADDTNEKDLPPKATPTINGRSRRHKHQLEQNLPQTFRTCKESLLGLSRQPDDLFTITIYLPYYYKPLMNKKKSIKVDHIYYNKNPLSSLSAPRDYQKNY